MDQRQRWLYGRRRGHKLRPSRLALLERRLPELAFTIAPGEQPALDPTTLFPSPVSEVWLEVGFGGGEHLAWQARHHPDVGFIGCEPYINGIASLVRHIDEAGLDNIRIYADDVRLLITRLLDASIARLFVLFPDPWPKKRHHKRRLVNAPMLDQVARILEDGAELRLATDHAEYARSILWHMSRRSDFRWRADRARDWRCRPPDWPETRYEAKAREEGRVGLYLRFERACRAGSSAARAAETP